MQGYRLLVTFEDKTEKICEISKFLDIGSFKELKDVTIFNQVKTTGYSVEWPNELDLSADTLLST